MMLLSLFIRLSVLQEKYPRAIVKNSIEKPFTYDLFGGRYVHINAILNATTMSIRPRLTSGNTNANAIPNTKKTTSRKKGN